MVYFCAKPQKQINMKQEITNERIGVIDALRGFALLGVVLIHMQQHYSIFSMGPFNEHTPILAQFDDEIRWLTNNVLMGRFINIFAFLFGMSFFIQMDRAEKKGQKFHLRFFWRMVLLFGIGLVGTCFYRGDILSLYAVYGVILLLLNFCKKSWVLTLLASLILLGGPKLSMHYYDKWTTPAEEVAAQQFPQFPFPMPNAEGGEFEWPAPAEGGEFDWAAPAEGSEFDWAAAFGGGEANVEADGERQAPLRPAFNFPNPNEPQPRQTFGEYVRQNITTGPDSLIGYQFNMSNRGYITLAIFIFGLVVGRSRFFESVGQRKRRNWILLIIFIAGTILFNKLSDLVAPEMTPMMWGAPSAASLLSTAFADTAMVLSSAALLIGFVILYHTSAGGRVLGLLSPYGRMGLTNYLMQSVIGSILFGMWAFGKTFFAFGATELLLLGLVVYVTQIVLSTFWLRYFKYGPIEWFWRSATYFKIQPMLKKRDK